MLLPISCRRHHRSCHRRCRCPPRPRSTTATAAAAPPTTIISWIYVGSECVSNTISFEQKHKKAKSYLIVQNNTTDTREQVLLLLLLPLPPLPLPLPLLLSRQFLGEHIIHTATHLSSYLVPSFIVPFEFVFIAGLLLVGPLALLATTATAVAAATTHQQQQQQE